MDFPTSGALMGTCPMLAAPCRPRCPFHVDGRCDWFGPSSPPVEIGGAANPRAWYLDAVNSVLAS